MSVGYIYQCEDSLEGILSAVHAAYMSRRPHDSQRIETGDHVAYSLFSELIYVETDPDKASRVADAIIHKISGYAWYMIRYASMALEPDKADLIYGFLVKGFRIGKDIVEQMADSHVMGVYGLFRKVQRETQKLYGFIRFQELKNGILISTLAPKHHQLPLLAPHFADRYPLENWILYDEKRQEVCVHERGASWWIQREIRLDELKISDISDQQKQFEEWWKGFYHTIGIKERYNPCCRRTLMPKMYWEYMPEMTDAL